MQPGDMAGLWLISVDTAEQNREFSEKIAADGGGKVPFPMLSDSGHRTIDAYGLLDPRYLKQTRAGIPYPTVYVVNKSGRVAWARTEEDFKKRPSNNEIRAALAALK